MLLVEDECWVCEEDPLDLSRELLGSALVGVADAPETCDAELTWDTDETPWTLVVP